MPSSRASKVKGHIIIYTTSYNPNKWQTIGHPNPYFRVAAAALGISLRLLIALEREHQKHPR
eukprot:951391-Pyramimonas_sp.AAC.2